jgi:heterodisulfide reductase subunit C/quinone-modifying oxidoreductase subunit QmoC
MERLTMRKAGVPLRLYLVEAWVSIVHLITHKGMLKCSAAARAAKAQGLSGVPGAAPSAEIVPHRWLKHWLMAFGTVMMVVLTAASLRWFQTDVVHPLYHPQRWLGYLATAFILWATTDILWRRIRHRQATATRRPGPLTLPLLLWLTAVSGIAVHVFRLVGVDLAAHYAYALHLVICVPMVLVEVPFGDWAHMVDRPLALYFQAVRERAREELPGEAGLEPARP